MPAAAPDDRIWIQYSREHAFPISTLTSVAVHVVLFALLLLGVFSLFGKHEAETYELEPVVILESPGGGMRGTDDRTRAGVAAPAAEATAALEPERRRPQPNIAAQRFPEVRDEADRNPLLTTDEADTRAAIDRKINALAPLQSLKPLLRGMPDHKGSTGGIARGSGQGTGTGPGTGAGDGSAGRLSQKQRRQLRWTLLFNIRSAPDYLDQLHRMKAIIGVQYADKSIKLITNLQKRPAILESGDRIPDRIFWMDDNPDAVRSLAEELGIRPVPWRVIAFFPQSLEDELLRKEKAYGLRFGRETEDDILETVFRVDDRYGIIDLSVSSQQGKK